MKKKKIRPFLSNQYGRLEKEEAQLRKDIQILNESNTERISKLITDVVSHCIANGKVDYSKLFKRISRQKIAEIRRHTKAVSKKFDSNLIANAYPFTIAKFDQLNVLNAFTAEIILNQLDFASDCKDLINEHLEKHIIDVYTAIDEYLDLYDMMTAAAIVAMVIDNKKYPTEIALFRSNMRIADRIAEQTKQAIIRGEEIHKTLNTIQTYAEKQSRSATDSVIFTEGTRTTVDTTFDTLRPYIIAFKSVAVHDKKTCKYCEQMEADQENNPVDIEYFEEGVTAPPFHPYCRCGFEVIWNDDL